MATVIGSAKQSSANVTASSSTLIRRYPSAPILALSDRVHPLLLIRGRVGDSAPVASKGHLILMHVGRSVVNPPFIDEA